MKQTHLLVGRSSPGTSDDAYTPPWVFEGLSLRFDLDVAAPNGGIPWVQADRFYTIDDDGLTAPWAGRVWMNPPYSKPAPWVSRFIQHRNGIALLPTTNGAWFLELWNSGAACVAMPPIKFVKPDGIPKAALPSRCWLWAFGETNIAALAAFGKVRV